MKNDIEASYEEICVTFLSVLILMMSEHELEHEHGYQVYRRGYLNSQDFIKPPLLRHRRRVSRPTECTEN